MNNTLNYEQVPYGFIHCLNPQCPQAATCLRHIAYELAPKDKPYFNIINPKSQIGTVLSCPHYLSDEPIRYAKGFRKLIDLLTIGKEANFRNTVISSFGRKNYYLTRNGDRLLSPAEQQVILNAAHKAGLSTDDLFDEYEYHYSW